MPAKAPRKRAARRRARTPQADVTSYTVFADEGNSEDDVWTDRVAFTLPELPDFGARERGHG